MQPRDRTVSAALAIAGKNGSTQVRTLVGRARRDTGPTPPGPAIVNVQVANLAAGAPHVIKNNTVRVTAQRIPGGSYQPASAPATTFDQALTVTAGQITIPLSMRPTDAYSVPLQSPP